MKPSIPKGTRDFLPHEFAQRQLIFSTIQGIFKKYGYHGIETPVMENLSTLTGKYGEEGDQLLFKVLNNGDYLAKADQEALAQRNSSSLTSSISKRGLRYDLTVPFARFVVMHQHEIQMPFKRYAIMPVWRADRPQKGRYQEFYQCDADVVGTDSLMCEAEMIQMIDEVFSTLNIPVEIKINNRKLLQAIAEIHGFGKDFQSFTVAVDKLDKIGESQVINEMVRLGIDQDQAQKAINLMSISSIDELALAIGEHEVGQKGLVEIKTVLSYLESSQIQSQFTLDLTLARGLTYYTGCILEVKALNADMGSIAGGGRYDNLTEVFGLSGTSGVGISFGAERIYDVMMEKGLLSTATIAFTPTIFLAFDPISHIAAFAACTQLRRQGIAADIYPEPAKMKKQMKYAADGNYRFVILVGEEELSQNQFTFKDMTTGVQERIPLSSVVDKLLK